MADILTLTDVSVHFGALKAVSRASFGIEPGTILGLIGPNGAGKTTLFNAITGHVPLTAGRIRFGTADITQARPHRRARLGIARTFQLGGVVDDLAVDENVALGLDHACRQSGRWMRRGDVRQSTHTWLRSFGLEELGNELAGNLSAGARREVEILRSIASGAQLVLLDEPGVGLSASERTKLVTTIRRCATDGKSFLITDHDTDIVFTASDQVVAMSFGEIIARGTPADVRQNSDVIRTYLGRNAEEEKKA